ncbi:MAG: 2-amino-4-hydroxy-6-hydroxymethyldihydropteridine diphosphokinase [Bacteroidales bacterium]|nr:2-amino-4-hydroxy-6-hydroxymethyldihydropteridine diphosphokinase [Bacteroidales bacterium]
MVNTAILSIGGNLGNRLENILRCVDYIERRIGKIVRRSSIYESEAWGFESEHRFLNMVVVVETLLPPESLLQKAHAIENVLLRQRTGTGYTSRTMDIDILFFNNEIINTPTLTIPHPRLHERRFVLLPLHEILPDMVHPVFQKSVGELLKEITTHHLCSVFCRPIL